MNKYNKEYDEYARWWYLVGEKKERKRSTF